MSAPWTVERVTGLAPDASSAKSGRDLARPSSWRGIGRSARALWGEIQGSGKAPYRTRVELESGVAACSCPSRKFPCKHALGLLFTLALEQGSVSETSEPDWVTEWLDERAKKAEAKAEKQASKAAPVVDEEARKERTERRAANVDAGVAELGTWLEDVVRRGVAAARSFQSEHWERAAARLVDAQAPGLAARVRELPALLHARRGGDRPFLDALGRLYLACEAWSRLGELDVEAAADVRAFVGFAWKEADLLALPRTNGRHFVAARTVADEDRLRVQRTWLVDVASGRRALVLDFAVRGAALPANLQPGTFVEAALVHHPGATPLRALVIEPRSIEAVRERLPGAADVAALFAEHAEALAANPWTTTRPYRLLDALVESSGPARVRDVHGAGLDLDTTEPVLRQLRAIGGGRGLDVFGEWDGGVFVPLAASTPSAHFVLAAGQDGARLVRVA